MRAGASTALVTGATGGIGACIAQELRARGYDVIAVARRPAPAADAHTIPVAADLTTAEGRAAIVAASTRAEKPVRLVVHAAGVNAFGLFDDADPADLARTLATNLTGPMALTQALMPLLRRNGHATIVGVGSTFGSIGYPGFAAYCAAKFGWRGFLEALSREHGRDGPRIVYLSPRATRTSFNDAAVDGLNAALGVAVDEPHAVARALVDAIASGRRRVQIGWPEKLFARVNGALPGLVDRAIARQLPDVRRAVAARRPTIETIPEETP